MLQQILLCCKNIYLNPGKITNIHDPIGKTDATTCDFKQATVDQLFKIVGIFVDINSLFEDNVKLMMMMMMIKLHHFYRGTF